MIEKRISCSKEKVNISFSTFFLGVASASRCLRPLRWPAEPWSRPSCTDQNLRRSRPTGGTPRAKGGWSRNSIAANTTRKRKKSTVLYPLISRRQVTTFMEHENKIKIAVQLVKLIYNQNNRLGIMYLLP
jgi:hypothetical protein